jgi:hypothetical protein
MNSGPWDKRSLEHFLVIPLHRLLLIDRLNFRCVLCADCLTLNNVLHWWLYDPYGNTVFLI